MSKLVFPSRRSYSLVACRQDDNSHKGEEEGDGTSDSPTAEDDTQILRGPVEKHL